MSNAADLSATALLALYARRELSPSRWSMLSWIAWPSAIQHAMRSGSSMPTVHANRLARRSGVGCAAAVRVAGWCAGVLQGSASCARMADAAGQSHHQ
ncbi:hypothetical protein ACTMU2_40955 [Cupriavidus basilensis]